MRKRTRKILIVDEFRYFRLLSREHILIATTPCRVVIQILKCELSTRLADQIMPRLLASGGAR